MVASPTVSDEAKRQLMDAVAPLLAAVAELRPQDQHTPADVQALEAELERRFPAAGEQSVAIGHALRAGVTEGWLCDRGEPNARFCRLAKPSPQTHDLSVDVVSLVGDAVKHTHPKGEVTLGFVAEAGAAPDGSTFDGRPPGWVFLGPGTTHIPRVEGERMILMYFLPDGAVQWHMAG